jgi:hypothetical protein
VIVPPDSGLGGLEAPTLAHALALALPAQANRPHAVA